MCKEVIFHEAVLDTYIRVEKKAINSIVNMTIPEQSKNYYEEDISMTVVKIYLNTTNGFVPIAAPSTKVRNKFFTSKVIRIEVPDRDIANLKKPLKMNFKINSTKDPSASTYTVSCQFYDEKGDKTWKTDGCETAMISDDVVECSCDHMTPFAVLLVDLKISKNQWEILSYISYTGCSLSAFFSASTVLMFIFNGNARAEVSSSIHVSLSGALFLLNMSFMFSEWAATWTVKEVCVFIAATIHYSLLCSFTWMAIEALHLYLLLIRVFNIYIKHYMVKLSLIGWGILITVSRQIFKLRKMGNRHNKMPVCKDLGTVLSLMCLLGTTWGLAFFSSGYTNYPILYLFCILNTMQENRNDPDKSGPLLHGQSVLGIWLGEKEVHNLSQPVQLRFLNNINQSQHGICVYWHFDKNGKGNWRTDGCTTSIDNRDFVCSCNRLGLLAVLINPEIPEVSHIVCVNYISYVGSALSTAFTALAIVMFLCQRKKQCEHSVIIHMQLSGSLYLLHFSFLRNMWFSGQRDVNLVCQGLGLLLHWCLLATFTWTAIEGFHPYLLLVRVFNIYIKRYLLKLSLVGWEYAGSNTWKTDGCNTTQISDNVVKCSCDHMTPFAVLLEGGGAEAELGKNHRQGPGQEEEQETTWAERMTITAEQTGLKIPTVERMTTTMELRSPSVELMVQRTT
ncbi:adhesion G -coupled receptor G3-like protein [Labeo rohita]|uniref:Adhesion G-coupled receptor G3-like protein n=1 Tax=Labeo rohita TaxID=84645 RepID=A0A498MCV0_LABRO|nr:adhesion G -coupled receptor G3-like protein [Labeo rohita]